MKAFIDFLSSVDPDNIPEPLKKRLVNLSDIINNSDRNSEQRIQVTVSAKSYLFLKLESLRCACSTSAIASRIIADYVEQHGDKVLKKYMPMGVDK